MDDEKQLFKYLSWLDDLHQEYICNTVDESLDINMIKEEKMDHSNLDTQTNPENGIPFSSNSNFEYSGTKIIPDYNVNDTILTNALETQPVAFPDTYQCNYNFLSNDNFYSNSLPTQPAPHKLEVNPDESHFSVDLNNTVPPGHDSYNASSSQLSMNTSAECSNMNILAEKSQIPLSDSIEIKDDVYFTEEKNIPLDTDYHPPAYNVPPTEDIKSTFPNDFTPTPDQSKMYSIDISQENIPAQSSFSSVTENLPNYSPVVENTPNYSPVNTAENVDTPVVENPPNSFFPVVKNTENQNNAVIPPAMNTQEDYHDPMKIDPDPTDEMHIEVEMKDRVKTEIIQEPTNEEPVQQVEESINQVSVEELKTETEVQPTVNGVENIKNENETPSVQMCIRNGCVNRAINHPEWEQEFCSNDCVIIHCRNVFATWVKTNEIQSQ